MAVVAAPRSKLHRLSGRKLFPLALALAALSVASLEGWLRAVPLPLLLATVVGASVVSEVVAVALPAGGSAKALHLRIAAQVAGVSVAVYATGWGAVLAAGYLYRVVDTFTNHGTPPETHTF